MKRSSLVGIVIAIVVVVAVVVFFVARQNTNDQTGTASPTANATVGNSTSPAASASGNAVEISGFAFSPASLSVKTGTTVTWTNKDSTDHTVTVDSGDGPKSSNIAQGQTYSFTFSKAGTYKYHCSIHPDMTATVTVTD